MYRLLNEGEIIKASDEVMIISVNVEHMNNIPIRSDVEMKWYNSELLSTTGKLHPDQVGLVGVPLVPHMHVVRRKVTKWELIKQLLNL